MLRVWKSACSNVAVSREELSDNTLYVIDFGSVLKSFTLERCVDEVRKVGVRDGVTTVCWKYFSSEADERRMIESVIHVMEGYAIRFEESTCRI